MPSSAPERLVSALADRYRIERPLGAGGMATVYLAEDLKHERQVAIKVLKPELAAVIGGERFVAEIKTTAKLQHPHILPLFDSGEADGYLFYVMPYVEGESLRDRLDREKQLGVEEALTLTDSVADALDYAHRNGVIHRDIKPANILLHDGRPIVADFGIAVAISAAGGGRLTETGLSLGTPHYMSPEQATADRDLTARSDVYSLACVLYEMLTGDPPHTASTAQAVLVRILTEPARPVTSVRSSVPPHVSAALAKALQKLPADRFRTAAEFRDALRDEHFTYTTAAPTQVGLGAPTRPSTTTRAWLSDARSKLAVAGVVGMGLVGLVAGMALSGGGEPGADARVYRYPVEPLEANPVFGLSGDDVVAYQQATDRGTILRARWPEDPSPIDLPGTEGGIWPVFSPDGDWLAFSGGVGGALKKIQLSTSTVVELVAANGTSSPLPTQWTEDEDIVFHVPGEGIYRVGADGGGDPELLVDAGNAWHGHLLPDDRSLVYTDFGSSEEDARVLLRDLQDGTTDTLATLGGIPRWASSGHILYGHPSGTIFALPFDLDTREATGPARPVQEGVRSLGVLSLYTISTSGSLAYVPGGSGASELSQRAFGWIEEDGAPTRLPIVTDHPDARLSPDGDQIAYTRDSQVYIFDVVGGTDRRLTFEGADHHDPVWSPDGSRLAFRRWNPEGGVFIQDVDGGSPAEGVVADVGSEVWSVWEWLADGTLVLMHRSSPNAPADLFTLRLGALDAEPTPLLQSEFAEMRPALSPDGTLIAYLSDATGNGFQLFVRRFPGMEGPWQVSEAPVKTDLAAGMVWSSDGSALHYQDQATGEVIRARITREPSPRVSARDVPFETYATSVLEDAHPAGRRFLTSWSMYFEEQTTAEHLPLTIAVNWLSEMRRRLGDGTPRGPGLNP